MKLISLKLNGFRRFDTEQTLQLGCKLVAILGHNEAGKSSILHAIQRLNSKTKFVSGGPAQDITRGEQIANSQPVIVGKFLLEEDDSAALKGISEANDARWFFVERLADGRFTHRIEPSVTRDFGLRSQVVPKVENLVPAIIEPTKSQDSVGELANSFVEALEDPKAQTLSATALDKLKRLRAALKQAKSPDYADLLREIDQLKAHEEREHPARRVERILASRVPEFVLFEDADRDLKPTYELATFFRDQNKVPIPRSLENVASAAQLDLEELHRAQQDRNLPHVRTLTNDASFRFNALMSAWKQADVDVDFDCNNGLLSILVRSQAGSPFESIEARSDGLRQFISLVAFLNRAGVSNNGVVVLIDEAEAHLRYDAQSELVEVFGGQRIANRVIYTTHSIGCLPEDLGLGVRFVKPTATRSKIVNRFWVEGRPGLSPVLHAMGAATMSFLPLRACLLTEGPSDILLLPCLLRQANHVDHLGFQVSPGLSGASDQELAIMKNEGSMVAFLVDGDDGGQAIADRLKNSGVEDGKIVNLRNIIGTDCMIEDFVDRDIYATAINEELKLGGPDRLTAEELPKTLRPIFIREWCLRNGLSEPHKVPVAYRILDVSLEKTVIDTDHAFGLQALPKEITLAQKA